MCTLCTRLTPESYDGREYEPPAPQMGGLLPPIVATFSGDRLLFTGFVPRGELARTLHHRMVPRDLWKEFDTISGTR